MRSKEADEEMKANRRLTLSARRSLYGYLFTLPFIIGCIVFFISPFIFYIALAFSKITLVPAGGGMILNFVGLENFKDLLSSDLTYVQDVIYNLLNIIVSVIPIILYSFFIALILNQKFKGRFLARAIFFLPVIISSGAAAYFNTDNLSTAANKVIEGISSVTPVAGSSNQGIYSIFMLLLGSSAVGNYLITFVGQIIGGIYMITMASGVQILIFLAGLQTISPSLYEAAYMDGATGWENFWKITLPMLSPVCLVNTIYTIIDCLAGANNTVVDQISNMATQNANYTRSSAMGVIYFAIIYIVLGIVLYVMSKFVYYEDR